MREIKTYKSGYIIKENKALAIKESLHSILYLKFYKKTHHSFILLREKEKARRVYIYFMSPKSDGWL